MDLIEIAGAIPTTPQAHQSPPFEFVTHLSGPKCHRSTRFEQPHNPIRPSLSVAWSLAIAISLLQLVGVWRSAGKHKVRGGSGFWAGTARFIVILGFLGLPSTL